MKIKYNIRGRYYRCLIQNLKDNDISYTETFYEQGYHIIEFEMPENVEFIYTKMGVNSVKRAIKEFIRIYGKYINLYDKNIYPTEFSIQKEVNASGFSEDGFCLIGKDFAKVIMPKGYNGRVDGISLVRLGKEFIIKKK